MNHAPIHAGQTGASPERTDTTTRARRVGAVIVTPTARYLYDVPSNRIALLEGTAEAQIAEGRLRKLDDETIVDRLSHSIGREAAENAFGSFATLCATYELMQEVPIREVRSAPEPSAIVEHLSHHIQCVTLNVTEDCNFRCRYCVFNGHHKGRRTHAQRHMSSTTARSAIDFFLQRCEAAPDPLAVCFYGGEPLLAFAVIREAVGYVKSRTSRALGFHLTTNGSPLTNRHIRAFLAEHDFSLLVSHDGPRDVHDAWRRLRGDKDTHNALEQTLGVLAAEYPEYYSRRVKFSCVLTPPASASRVIDYFNNSPLFQRSTKELRVAHAQRDSHTVFPTDDPESVAKEMHELRSRYVASRRQCASRKDGLGAIYELPHARLAQRSFGRLPEQVVPSGTCVPGGRKLFVSVDGQLGICEKAGDVQIGSLAGGFDYDRVRGILVELFSMWRRSCSWCVAQRFCSICPVLILDGASLSQRRFRAVCKSNRLAFLQSLSSFLEVCESNPEYLGHLQSITIS